MSPTGLTKPAAPIKGASVLTKRAYEHRRTFISMFAPITRHGYFLNPKSRV